VVEEEIIREIIDPPFFEEFEPEKMEELLQKHQQHDQSTHGNWAKGSEAKTVTGLISKLYEKKTPGFSINIKSRRSPKTGYISSDDGAEKEIDAKDFYSSRDASRKYVVEYMKQNSAALSKRGAYFGGWRDGDKVFLDVSRRYETRQQGIDAGKANKQKAIYDVANDAYIYIGEQNGEANKAVDGGSSETSESDDGRGIERIRRRDFGRDGEVDEDDINPLEEFTLTVHTSNGRSLGIKPGEFVTEKHYGGGHDQQSHGNWSDFGSDSSQLARNGAKRFAAEAGVKQDDTIVYPKVVANLKRASRIADAYDKLPDFDKEAVDEFESLASEVDSQFDFMTKKLGVKVEFVSEDPYKSSKEMFKDVSQKKLKVLSTESTGGHPFFTDAQNNKFRAVHDFFGHAATGRGFGQDGEEAAWVHHSQMFTRKARLALTTETRGQNSWFNTRKNGFAKQKVALLPEEFVIVPETFEKHQSHDQSTHGNWAAGSSDIVPDITENMKTYFGKNLEEYLESEGHREILKRQEKRISGKDDNENKILEIIAEKQGFAGKPKVVSPQEMANLEKQGWTIAYRGIANPGTVYYGQKNYTSEEFAEDFKNGDYYAGAGVTGDGIYLTTNYDLAKTYAETNRGQGTVLKVAIPPRFTDIQSGQGKGLKRENYLDEVSFQDEVELYRQQIDRGKGASFRGADDIGVVLAAKGIRGVKQKRSMKLKGNEFGDVEVFLIWDRSMLAVEGDK